MSNTGIIAVLMASSRAVGIPADDFKFRLTFTDDTTYDFALDASTVVSSANVTSALASAGKTKAQVKTVLIGEGMTEVSASAFTPMTAATIGPTFPSTLTDIGYRAFFEWNLSGTSTVPVFHPDSTVTFAANPAVGSPDVFRRSSFSGAMTLPAGSTMTWASWYDCEKLTAITFLDRIDLLQKFALGSMALLATITFEQTTAPTSAYISEADAWICRGTSVKVYVPATGDSLATWKAAIYASVMTTAITHINDIPIASI